jgi:hypothetical protein
MDEGSDDNSSNDLTLRPRQQAKDFFAPSGWTTESAKTSLSSMKCKKCAPWDVQASVTMCTECTDASLANKFQNISV